MLYVQAKIVLPLQFYIAKSLGLSMQKLSNISVATAKRDLKKLVDEGRLERKGSGRNS